MVETIEKVVRSATSTVADPCAEDCCADWAVMKAKFWSGVIANRRDIAAPPAMDLLKSSVATVAFETGSNLNNFPYPSRRYATARGAEVALDLAPPLLPPPRR